MRFYDIRMTDPDGKLMAKFGFAKAGFDTSYTSYLNGRTITGALNIEANIPQAPYATPQQGAWLRIWGVGLDELANSSALGPPDGKLCGIVIKAGMQKGLPLAKPAQIGVIADASIFKPFGNWQGTDQTLEMVILPGVGTNNGQLLNIVFDYKSGPIADAIKQSLSTIPGYTAKINISPNLVLSAPRQSIHTNLTQFSSMLLKISLEQQFQGIKPLGGGKYGGIQFSVIGKTINVYDGTSDYAQNTFAKPKIVDLEDVIGQPTWIGPNSVNFKCTLRGDINVGDYVKLPPTLAIPYVLTTPGASIPGAASRNSLAFQGVFVIINIRHYMNYRSPSADAWTTSYNATYVADPGALIAAAPKVS